MEAGASSEAAPRFTLKSVAPFERVVDCLNCSLFAPVIPALEAGVKLNSAELGQRDLSIGGVVWFWRDRRRTARPSLRPRNFFQKQHVVEDSS